MIKRFASIFLITLSLTTVCCKNADKSQDEQKPRLTVSIEPLRNIVEQIAGDDYDVVTVLDKGSNPETFEPSMSRRAAVDKSELFVTVGAFQFEEALAESSAGKTETIDASEGIERLYGTHSHDHGDCSGGADPHTWTSAKNAKAMAKNVAAALQRINPGKHDEYGKALGRLLSRIDSLDIKIAEQLAGAPQRAFAIWHPSLSYYARDYGLEQIAVGEESKEISPRRLKEIIEHAAGHDVRVFFFQKEFDSRQAKSINDQIGSRLVTIDPLAYDWMSQLETIANELSR